MIAELLVDSGYKPASLSIYRLYSHFVQYVMDRETRKPARSTIDQEPRLKFIRSVAWWLWTVKRDNFFTYDELPKELIKIVADKRSVTAEPLIRELLVGSILDRGTSSLLAAKGADFYYFAHKSYWEFLVCEYMLRDDMTDKDVKSINDKLTTEVLQFLQSADDETYSKIYVRLSEESVEAHIALFELAARHPLALTAFESERYNLSKNEYNMLGIGLQHVVDTGLQDWSQYFFEAERRAPQSFSGMIFGLVYWAVIGGKGGHDALYVAAALCGVAAQRWLQRQEPRRVYEISLGSDQEACLSSFLESIESIDSTGLAIDCELLLTRLVERGLVLVFDGSIAGLKLSTEYLDADRLEVAARNSDISSPIVALRQAHSRLTGIRAAD